MARYRHGKARNIEYTGTKVFSTLGTWVKALRGRRYAITTMNSNGVEVTDFVDYHTYCEEGYKRNATLFACIRMLVTSAPTARMQVQKRLTRGQTEIYEDHYLQKVLDLPNFRQSHYEFIELRDTYYYLDGNAFILIGRENGRTNELWLPQPDRMHPVINRSKSFYDPDALLGFVYRTLDGESIGFLPEDVMHIKFPNPNDPYGGLGRGIPPVMSAAYDVDNDNSQASFIRQFFKNGAVPSGIIKSKNILDDAEVKRIQKGIADQYSGEQNWHKTMVLDADAEYQQTGLSMDKMVFPELQSISEARICSVMGVPPVLIGAKAGLDAATYSNYKLARSAMWEDHIMTNNQKMAEAYTRAFSKELGENVIIQHDYSKVVALQEDRTERFNRSNQAILGGWITVNEGRREVGLGPLPEGVGDVLYRPLMIEAIDDGEGDASQKVLKNQVVTISPTPLGVGTSMKRLEAAQLVAQTPESEKAQRDAFGAIIWKRFDRIARAWEKKFKDKAAEIFEAEGKSIEAAIRSQKSSIKDIGYTEIWKAIETWLVAHGIDPWASSFEPLMFALTQEQMADWGAALGIDWTLDNPAVASFIREYSYEFARKVNTKTTDSIRTMMTQAQTEGWSISRMIDEIRSVYSGWSGTRAETIARSETIRSSNAGELEAFREAGIETQEWYASIDERTCVFCGEMHEKQLSVGGVWQTAGSEMVINGQRLVMDYGDVKYPPLHPDCRCTILPVLLEKLRIMAFAIKAAQQTIANVS